MQEIREDEVLEEVNERVRLIRKRTGLTLGTDAYLLAAFAPVASGRIVADLGSGTGIIPLLLLARGKCETAHAVEIQPAFADLIRRNAALNGVADRLLVHEADVRHFGARDTGGTVDAVFANPPYQKAGSGIPNPSDYKRLARHEENGGIADFCLAAARLLNFGGKFFCVFRPDRLPELFEALRAAGLEPKRLLFVHADAEHEPSMLLLEARRGGAPGIRVLPPLFLHDVGVPGRLSARAAKIYETCSF